MVAVHHIVLPAVISTFALNAALCEALPHTSIRYINSATLETARMLRKQIIHMGFVYGEHIARDLTVRPITTVAVNVVVPACLAEDGGQLTWHGIARLPWIWGEERCPSHCRLQALIGRQGLAINKVSFTVDEEMTKQLVEDGQGVALVRADQARDLQDRGAAVIWEPGTVAVPFGVAYLSTAEKSGLIQMALGAILGVWDRDGRSR